MPTGLDPFSSLGPDGAGGDPDGDGLTNLQEWRTGSHPRGFFTTYLAEGVSGGSFMTETVLTAAVTPARDAYYVTYEFAVPPAAASGGAADGAIHTCATGHVVGAQRRYRIPAAGCTWLSDERLSEVSARLESDTPLVLERTVSWPTASGSPGAPAPSPEPTVHGAHAEGGFAVARLELVLRRRRDALGLRPLLSRTQRGERPDCRAGELPASGAAHAGHP